MRIFLVWSCCLLLSAHGFTQDKLPPFGTALKAELVLTDCAFDSGAAAMKLLDQVSVFYTHTSNDLTSLAVLYEYRVRIKILTREGIAQANIAIPFVSHLNKETILRVKACTYNLVNETKTRRTMVQKKAIYTRRINQQKSELRVFFPEVKVGSVIEYQYTLQSRQPSTLKEWQFQTNLPTRYSAFEVNLPEGFSYAVHPLTADSMETSTTTWEDRFYLKNALTPASMNRKRFIMRNLPALPNEPMMGAVRDYQQRIFIQLSGIDYGNSNTVPVSSDWEDVVKELLADADFGQWLKAPLKEMQPVIAAATAEPTELARIQYLLSYVQQHWDWNETEGIYAQHGLLKTWQQKTGSQPALTLMLINLLKASGFEASPVLFSTRTNGLVNKSLPLINQFNQVIAMVQVNNQTYLLDAADKQTPYWLTPEKITGTKGFVVEKVKGRWIDAGQETDIYKLDMAINGFADSTGTMTGNLFLTGTGYAVRDLQYQQTFTTASQHGTELPNGMRLRVQPEKVNVVKSNNKALEQKYSFNFPLASTGTHYYFSLNTIPRFHINPFLAEQRKTDIDFGYPQQYNIYGSYFLPSGFVYETIPPEILLTMPDSSIVFKRFVQANHNTLNVRISLIFNRSVFAAASYPDLSAFYKILLQQLNEPVIITTKTRP